MAESLESLFSRVTPDPWRDANPFSPEVGAASAEVRATTADDKRVEILARWLSKHQPCLFGKIAAKSDLISYCVLDESDILRGDEHVRGRIQQARASWTRDGFSGRKSGFILWVVSPKLEVAEPNDAMLGFAQRLCSLYLLEDVEPDKVYLDEIFLEYPSTERRTWKWVAGVNYFASCGDGRWWQDHRIPAGIAFSVNSVGHMVKSGLLSKTMSELEAEFELTSEWPERKVATLSDALELAMRTIANASNARSGPATHLVAQRLESSVRCPIELRGNLAGKNHCEYFGYYHTDVTLPSEYFWPNADRPAELRGHALDFTYLFHASPLNLDYGRMGAGRLVRAEGEEQFETAIQLKRMKSQPTIARIDEEPRLAGILRAT